MTLASVNVNFTLALAQHQSASDVEEYLSGILLSLTQQVGPIVEFDVLPGTQTKVNPFIPAEVKQFPRLTAIGQPGGADY